MDRRAAPLAAFLLACSACAPDRLPPEPVAVSVEPFTWAQQGFVIQSNSNFHDGRFGYSVAT